MHFFYCFLTLSHIFGTRLPCIHRLYSSLTEPKKSPAQLLQVRASALSAIRTGGLRTVDCKEKAGGLTNEKNGLERSIEAVAFPSLLVPCRMDTLILAPVLTVDVATFISKFI